MGPSLRLLNRQTTFSIIWSFGVQLDTLLLRSEKGNGTEHKSRGKNSLSYLVTKRELDVYIYMNKDENPSTKSTMHVKANVNTPKENQNNQNSSNEVEDPMLKGLSIANLQLF